jgi:hypothetical protein
MDVILPAEFLNPSSSVLDAFGDFLGHSRALYRWTARLKR